MGLTSVPPWSLHPFMYTFHTGWKMHVPELTAAEKWSIQELDKHRNLVVGGVFSQHFLLARAISWIGP